MSDKWFWIGFVGTMALLLLARVGAVAVRVWYQNRNEGNRKGNIDE